MYPDTYMKDIYGNETISIRNTASVIELFLRILLFFCKLRNIGVKKKRCYIVFDYFPTCIFI